MVGAGLAGAGVGGLAGAGAGGLASSFGSRWCFCRGWVADMTNVNFSETPEVLLAPLAQGDSALGVQNNNNNLGTLEV